MSLIHCPECGKEISETVKNCPNCGFEIKPENIPIYKKSDRYGKYVSYAFGFIVLFILFKICTHKDSTPATPWQEIDASTMAYIMTEDWVKQRLKSPSTAKFLDTEKKEHTTRNGQVYKISSYVDSENSFGGMMRTNFTATVEQIDNEKWKLIDLKFSE